VVAAAFTSAHTARSPPLRIAAAFTGARRARFPPLRADAVSTECPRFRVSVDNAFGWVFFYQCEATLH
jgi:hypothetical protein